MYPCFILKVLNRKGKFQRFNFIEIVVERYGMEVGNCIKVHITSEKFQQ